MIPISLSLKGFLSYRDSVELNLSSVDLACIAGANGAGKSSLLDAITWVLFGQARKRDESLINAQSDAAEVRLVFAYETNTYRVQRTLQRGKTTVLEFNIFQSDDQSWKVLTERTLRETQARIEQILRLDYETFVNASFFLQGKADQFTQQKPGDRKRILSSILGLEVWETYRERASERRKLTENDITALQARLEQIQTELDEEAARKGKLQQLEEELEGCSKIRITQEKVVESARKIAIALAEQERLVIALKRQVDETLQRLDDLTRRADQRLQEKTSYDSILERADEIEKAYQTWVNLRADLERWEMVANAFRQQEELRQAPLDEITTTCVRLEKEKELLEVQRQVVSNQASAVKELESQQETIRGNLAQVEAQLAQRARLEEQLKEAQQKYADARAENPRLKAEMDELKSHIDQLRTVEGAECPFCKRPLNDSDRAALVDGLTAQGTSLGDRYRANRALMDEFQKTVHDLENQIKDLAQVETYRLKYSQALAQYNVQLEMIRNTIQQWETQDNPRLIEVTYSLQMESYCPEARIRLAEIDAELKAFGYDATAHDATRQSESESRSGENAYHELEKARAALGPLSRELEDLQSQITRQKSDVVQKQQDYEQAATRFTADAASAPDLVQVERELLLAQEQENRLRLEVGAARQKVEVLTGLKRQYKKLEGQRAEKAHLVGRYKQLERAFGKDGIPALLIEQALPQIEVKANEILDRLSGGNMSVRFITQAAFKEKRREDLRETLDIQLSDGVGVRDYEMFSGGEAFRANFAIRLALSEILAQRAGARLQTLVIDEGFGSQDALGRQRLIEAINQVRQDFAKILVITHIEELKDAFPARIEVEKTERGSMARIV